jgi:hypothetical protein
MEVTLKRWIHCEMVEDDAVSSKDKLPKAVSLT